MKTLQAIFHSLSKILNHEYTFTHNSPEPRRNDKKPRKGGSNTWGGKAPNIALPPAGSGYVAIVDQFGLSRLVVA